MFHIPARFQVGFCDSQGPDTELYSPNDQRPLTKIQYATADDINDLLKKIPLAQKKMSQLEAIERSEILRKVAKLIAANAEELAWLISTEGGKPLRDARVEVSRAQVTLELCAEEAVTPRGETIPMERGAAGKNHIAFTTRDPIGPVLAISAFNHPLNLLAHQVGCAIAAGCMVVIKPAPSTPLNAFKLEGFFKEAGLPSECITVVNSEIPEIEALISSSVFGYVNFIGSAKVGWEIRRKLAPGTRLGLEHGGQAPAIVRSDAKVEEAISLLLKGSFYHAGQVCISTQRIFVHESIYKNFLSAFTEGAERLITGDATSDKTDVGPLIRPKEVKRIREWIDEAIEAGAKLITGNKVSGSSEQYLSPTVLSEVPRNCKVMTDEVFGPLVCINPYSDEEELLNYLNGNEYIFEASVFTQDIQKALKIAKDFSTMTMMINNHTAYRVDWMPFGGHKLSGLGMGGVKYLVDEMTRLKQIIIKL